MADVFEDRPEVELERARLWQLIEATPNLDWLLLTKRPENISSMAPWEEQWPRNIWLGTTVESQEYAEERLPILADLKAPVKFISAEPLLGPLDVRAWLGRGLDWVITGGETGPNARVTDPNWFQSLMMQCRNAAVPFHFKQWGDWSPNSTLIHSGRSPRLEVMPDGTKMYRIGKKTAGRTLNGRTWDGLPKVA
jgi:protein gp37